MNDAADPQDQSTKPLSFWEGVGAVLATPLVILGMLAACIYAPIAVGFSIKDDIRRWMDSLPKRSR